jgi:hypothetical protein
MADSQLTVDNYCGCTSTRRRFIWEVGAGFGGLALTSLLDQGGFFAQHGFAETAAPYTSRQVLHLLILEWWTVIGGHLGL